MLSERLYAFAHETWEKTKPSLGDVGRDMQDRLDATDGERRALLELALGTLPASDAASVPFEVLAAYADHALFLRENSPYCKDIPEDIFLHCVYYPRINSEDLVDCRKFFYDQLADVVEGKSGTEAALAVNRWCAAQMTYETTDNRTINPMTAYSCGLGRCGEESTFGVTALRSVGIPARQIYVPWWSHCDDNHAWVEAYVDGSWHFLGACEPEPTLDRGWFVNASSRAMVVCSQNFFDYIGEGLASEGLVQRKGICLSYNQVSRYAAAAPVTVVVRDTCGQPISGAWVRFYVENMASDACIAALETDGEGRVQLETGFGSMLVEAEYRGRFARETVHVDGPVTLSLTPAWETPDAGDVDWDFEAPVTGHKHKANLTPKEQTEKSDVLKAAKAKRLARIEGYYLPVYRTGEAELEKVFKGAGGHAAALWAFYEKYGSEARDILLSLRSKDWRDADTDVLAAHIEASRKFRRDGDPNFLPYIQCPRIGNELLTNWREPVEKSLSAEEKDRFRAEPAALWAWICENFREGECRWQPVLWLQPGAALRLGAANLKGRRLLFVAVLRTLGVPARLDPVDGRAQYWRQDGFCTVEAAEAWEPKAALKIKGDSTMVYFQSWGLARWNGGFTSLELEDEDLSRLELPLGLYRLTTVNRLPNGNQLLHFHTFKLEKDMELNLAKRPALPEQLLANYQVVLPVETRGLELQLYLEVGAEPTEHSLNELLEAAERVREMKGLTLHFLLPRSEDRADPTLKKVLAALPDTLVEETDFGSGTLETLARALYLEPGAWPLMTLTDGKTAYYGHGGYAVGSVGLALELAELVIAGK